MAMSWVKHGKRLDVEKATYGLVNFVKGVLVSSVQQKVAATKRYGSSGENQMSGAFPLRRIIFFFFYVERITFPKQQIAQ